MAQARATIATLCALLLAQSQALRVSHVDNTTESTLACVCKDWDDVYKSGEVTCGQGMEFYFLMSGRTNVSTDVRHKLALTKHHQGASLVLKNLMNTSTYARICTNFFMKANFNYCMARRFMATDLNWKKSKGTWCYVSNKCHLPTAEPIEGTNLAAKRCSEAIDVSVGYLPIDMAGDLSKQQHLSLGVLSGHSYIHVDQLVSEITGKQLNGLMEAERDHYIWSLRNYYAPRWVVRKQHVWEHTYNNATKNWDVKCIKNCIM